MEKYTDMPQNGGFQQLVCDKTVFTELSGDFTLPDYQPEIKRLLRVSASVLPPSKYVGNHGASLAGNLDYYVLYTGSDNALYCAPLSAEYKVEIPLDRADELGDGYLQNLSAVADSVPDMISGRVTAPRKISIKCRLMSRVQIFGELPLENGFDESDGSLQMLYGKSDALKRCSGIGETVKVTDEMICDSRDGEIRVISAEGRVLITEASHSVGNVFCRGDLYLKLLLCREGGDLPYVAVRKIPISGNVSVEGAKDGADANARGSVSELSITVEEGRIGIEAGVLLEVETCHREEIGYVKDVYSVSRAAANSYKDVPVLSLGESFGGNFTLSDSLTLDEVGIAPGARIIDVCGVAKTEDGVSDGERCQVTGKVRFSLLCEKDGEYSVSEAELPFTYRTAVKGGFDKVSSSAEVISARARVDGERLGIDAEIGIIGVAYSIENKKMLSEVAFGDACHKGRGEFVVCYPAFDDSAWSVAKRYGVELAKFQDANGLDRDLPADSQDALKGVKYLVI